MKNIVKIIASIVATIFFAIACSDDDEAPINGQIIKGVIKLSGDETSQVGTSLSVGNIALGIAGNKRTVTLTDKNTPIVDTGPLPDDPENNFIIVGLDLGDKATDDVEKGLSINISVDGTDYKYACDRPFLGDFTDCGADFYIDFDVKEIVFDSTTVVNTKTESILTLYGTVTW